MTLKYIWRSFSLRCHFHVHFSYPWHAFASHGLPAIAELLVCWNYCNHFLMYNSFYLSKYIISAIPLQHVVVVDNFILPVTFSFNYGFLLSLLALWKIYVIHQNCIHYGNRYKATRTVLFELETSHLWKLVEWWYGREMNFFKFLSLSYRVTCNVAAGDLLDIWAMSRQTFASVSWRERAWESMNFVVICSALYFT